MNEPTPDQEMPNVQNSEPPPKMVLFTLGGLVFLCMMMGSGLLALACQLQGIDMKAVFAGFGADSPVEIRNFMRGALLLNHTATFLLPALLVGWIFYKKNWSVAVLLDRKPSFSTLVQGLLFVMAAFTFAQFALPANRWLVEQLPFMESLASNETATESLMLGLLVMQSPWEMLFSILVMAVVPAVGEEMVFRGFVQHHLVRLTRRPALSIGLAALIFSLAHFQAQRLLPILLLGVALGLLFYWTKSLWVPIAAHFFNNGAQVVVAYFNQDKLSDLNEGVGGELPLPVIALAAILLGWTGYLLWKKSRSNDQPPAGFTTI